MTVPAARLGLRGFAAAAIVAAIVGALFPYVTLALGFGPNVSLLATFLGVGAISACGARGRGALVAAQAAGVAAGQTAFMGTALAALELLRARGVLELELRPSSPIIFAWLATAGVVGVLAAIPLRRHFIDDERLVFAAGAAAGEAIVALADAPDRARDAPRPHRGLGRAAAAGAIATLVHAPLSPLGLGSGVLVGARIALSMGAGALLGLAVPAARSTGVAAALLISGGATRAIVRGPAMIRALRAGPRRADSRVGRAALVLVGGLGLCAIDRWALATSLTATVVSLALAAPLVLIGTRVLGETNWAPVGALAAVAQLALAAVVPGCAVVNLIGSAVAAAIPNAAQHMMQTFRAAARAGTCPRDAARAQLIGVIVGAAMLSVAYPVLAARFGVGGSGLTSPLSVAWADVAVAATRGGAGLDWPMIAGAAVAGIGLALAERRHPRVPSAAGLGIGLLAPGRLVAGIVLGGVVDHLAPATRDRRVAIASGLVAGEAIAATAAAFTG